MTASRSGKERMYIPSWSCLTSSQIHFGENLRPLPFPLEAASRKHFYVARNGIYHLFRALNFASQETVLVPDSPTPAPDVPGRESARVQPGASLDLADFDRTAFETMRAPIDTPKPPPAPSTDPNVIDFELFDPDTEAEIAPKPVKR